MCFEPRKYVQNIDNRSHIGCRCLCACSTLVEKSNNSIVFLIAKLCNCFSFILPFQPIVVRTKCTVPVHRTVKRNATDGWVLVVHRIRLINASKNVFAKLAIYAANIITVALKNLHHIAKANLYRNEISIEFRLWIVLRTS